jgi:imidazolonepropionase
MENEYCLIGPISQLITLADLPEKGPLKDEVLQPILEAGILMQGELIYKIGRYSELLEDAETLKAKKVVLEGNQVCVPGFIDAHTHICFAGSRANDYAMRNSGKSYLEISLAGGGIWDTVKATRKASLNELTALTKARANKHLHEGVTTIEVKSGYGLSVAEELKMLRAIAAADKETEADLILTCLAAHTLPKDFEGTHEMYLQQISDELFPIIQKENLTTRVDAFIEQGAFSAEVIHPYFVIAQQYGFSITVHADQFSAGGSAIAVDFNAVSADHLEASGDPEINLLAHSEVVAVALPGASIGLGCAFTPARKILDAGGCLAIASDWNPGSAPMGDLLTQAAILGTFQKLSNAEVWAGITFRAAKALNLFDRGQLIPGMLADFNLFATSNHQEILYQQGKLKPVEVWKNGKCVHSNLKNEL